MNQLPPSLVRFLRPQPPPSPTANNAPLVERGIATPSPETMPQQVYSHIPNASPAEAPTFAHPIENVLATQRNRRLNALLITVLTFTLVLQLLLADRARLASNAAWRPLLNTLCTVLRCSLPAWHEPTAFTMLQRNVQPLHGYPGVLEIEATFRNDARWDQAWPYLQLSLSDADGKIIGSSTFTPTEYLGHPPRPNERLTPGQSAHIVFRVHEREANTAAFTFEFR
ncbi:DUF3426 domain-containing protein [Xylella fastidiosa subsp. multiplex]|uniref:DUF3426 domain-containing protein n=2 Tax=Xylella fastidiosa subsp. multiplex TaxID=644357 RepID=A0A9Q4MKX7_XYLFS|nr:conserved hypothetical protein [Xylella fastidiosa M12]MBE0268675.1 DUF3426 domain-containing protein [Xylella fastidiosa subsp. multiplex]MDS9989735.1 hypothetical protein [Xylella fastidiosa]MBE0274917.1 DUF3426 domain-containing protein [Xylella fastidiosa subsp. multiplex]MBE0277201.1 DUF3426 domain-containing protein [Xylella fastidiosa subsp. multiplex]